jgi:hypothetical protein
VKGGEGGRGKKVENERTDSVLKKKRKFFFFSFFSLKRKNGREAESRREREKRKGYRDEWRTVIYPIDGMIHLTISDLQIIIII